MPIGLAAVSLVSCSTMGGGSHDASTAPLAQEVRRATQRFQDVTDAPPILLVHEGPFP